jgi:inorganic pyrophosphatase
MIYPLDYGYLAGTSSADGDGIDIWLGGMPERRVMAVICIVDLMKRDSEIKVLVSCTREEIDLVYMHHNNTAGMKGILNIRSLYGDAI